MTLALLLTAVTGAWAQDPTVYTSEVDMSVLKVGDILAEGFSLKADNDNKVNLNANRYRISEAPATSDKELYKNGITVGTNCVLTYNSVDYIPVNEDGKDGNVWVITKITNNYSYIDINISGSGTAETPVIVEWNASTKTGTFEMPGSDVVLTPIYAKAAAFATTGTEPEVKTLLPEAAEGVIAGTDASLIKEGTGIVAFAGTSTDVTQGTLMYAIGTSATEAPALTAFSATVPTAENVADDGATLYVWYYIQGADAPEGEAATLDNTFNDTEPACLTVQVLTNKFDIQFNAANANTIEAGKATVTVGGTAATVTEGKLEGVKMGSEVKMTAKEGYKFRKVEVKKKAAKPATITVTWNYDDITGSGNSFTKDGVTITAGDIDFDEKNFKGGGTFTTTLGNFTKIEVTTSRWQASGEGWSGSTWTGNASSVSFSDDIKDRGEGTTKFVFTIEPTN